MLAYRGPAPWPGPGPSRARRPPRAPAGGRDRGSPGPGPCAPRARSTDGPRRTGRPPARACGARGPPAPAAPGGNRRGQRVEGVEIRHHLGIGPRVVGDGDTVAGADPEEEAPGKALFQRGDGRPDVLGSAGPDADDATGHRHVGGGGQQLLEVRREPGVEAARGPQRPVAEGLELGGDAAPGIVGVPPRTAPPHADATEVHARHRTRAGLRSARPDDRPPLSRGGAGGRPCRRERLGPPRRRVADPGRRPRPAPSGGRDGPTRRGPGPCRATSP